MGTNTGIGNYGSSIYEGLYIDPSLIGTEEQTGVTGTTNPFEGDDAIINFNWDPYSRFQSRTGSDYNANSHNPQLQQPHSGPIADPAFVIGVQNLYASVAQEKLIDKGISPEDIKEIVKYLLDPNSTTLSPENKSIADEMGPQITKEVIQQTGLPDDWSVLSNPTQWIAKDPSPLPEDKRTEIFAAYDAKMKETGEAYINQQLNQTPPGLSNEEAADLKNAIESGIRPTDSKLATIYDAIQSKVTAFIQVQEGLPTSWARGVELTDTANWTPVNASVLNPLRLQLVRSGMMANNMINLLESINSIIQETIANSDPAISNALKLASGGAMIDFLKTIMTTLHSLKDALRDMQIKDAELHKEMTAAKFDTIDNKKKIYDSQQAKQQELTGKQKTMQAFSSIMLKIVGPIVATLAVVASVLMTVATFGAATPAGVALSMAGIAFATAMFAISVADATTNGSVTQAITSGLGDALEALTNFLADDLLGGIIGDSIQSELRIFVKAVLIVAVVVAVVAIVVASGGSAAGGAAASAASAGTASAAAANAVAVQVFKAGMTPFFMMLMSQTIMSPKGLPAIASDILLKVNPNASEQDKFIAQMIAMSVGLITCMVAMGASSAGGFRAFAREAADSASKLVRNMGTSFKSALEAARESLTRLGTLSAQQIAKEVVATIGSAFAGLAETLKEILNIPRNAKLVSESMINFVKGFKDIDLFKLSRFFKNLATISPLAAQAIGGVVVGIVQLRQSELLKEIGELQAAEEQLKAVIKLFEQILASLMAGLSELPEEIDGVIRQITEMFKKSEQSLGKFTNAMAA